MSGLAEADIVMGKTDEIFMYEEEETGICRALSNGDWERVKGLH